MTATAGAGARLEGYKPEIIELTPDKVLSYIYERLVADGSLAGRLDGAAAIFTGTAESATITTHDASDALKGAGSDVTSQLVHGPQGPASLLTLRVADVKVDGWIKPPEGDDKLWIAWVMTGSTAAANPGVIPAPKSGLVLLRKATGPLPDEVAKHHPDAWFWPGGPPAMVADPGGEVASAARFWVGLRGKDAAQQRAEAEKALGTGSGALTQVALKVLVEAGSASAPAIATEVASGKQPPAAELAMRAALWKLGAKDDATKDLDIPRIDASAMNAFGLVLQPDDEGKPWAFQAPDRDSALDAGALSGTH